MPKTDRPVDSNSFSGNTAADIMKDHTEQILLKLISLLKKELKNVSKESKDITSDLFSEWDSLERQHQSNQISLFAKNTETQKILIKAQKAWEDQLYKKASENHLKKDMIDIRSVQSYRLKEFKKEYEYKQQQELLLIEKRKQLELEKANKLKSATTDEEKELITNEFSTELSNILNQLATVSQDLANAKDNYSTVDKDIKDTDDAIISLKAESGDPELMKEAAESLHQAAKQEKAGSKERIKLERQARNLEKEAADQALRDRNADRKAELKYRLTTLDGIKDTLSESFSKMGGALIEGLSSLFDSVEKYIDSFYEYQAKYQSRLEGSENEYAKLTKEISKQIGISPFVSQKKTVENLQKLIDTGTNYNLELRAYIATVSENIASTFDAFDSNLLRLIRLQQNDSTAARLGIETALTNMLNNMYSDTSYLSDVSDTVSKALLDASAQLTHQGATELEFVAQKWLGSLYSVGISGEAVQSIATGLGYLGSGNLEQLGGNEALMSLLTLSAARGGTSIATILNNGLTADTTNSLLKGMMEYLSEIANNTDTTNVTKSAISQIFGLTNTDLRAISNLTSYDIDKIYSTNLNYNSQLSQAASSVKSLSSKTHVSTMVQTLVDNVLNNAANMIGSTAPTYILYKALNVASNLIGDRGLEIPGIQALGTGTGSGIDVVSVMKAGLSGWTLIAGILSSLDDLGSGFLPSLSDWSGYETALERGSGIELGGGVQSGYSQSAVINSRANTSGDDMTKAAMSETTSKAKQSQGIDEEQDTVQLSIDYYEAGIKYFDQLSKMYHDLKEEEVAALKVHVEHDPSDPIPVMIQQSGESYIKADLVKVNSNAADSFFRSLLSSVFGVDISSDQQAGLPNNSDLLSQLRERLEGLAVTVSGSNDFEINNLVSGNIGGQ